MTAAVAATAQATNWRQLADRQADKQAKTDRQAGVLFIVLDIEQLPRADCRDVMISGRN